MLLLWRVLAVAGGCCFLRVHEGKEERGRARQVTLPAGVMRAVGCDCCGEPHSFRCALLRRCAVRLHMSFVMRVLDMCFRSVGRPPPFFFGLCEWARAGEGQGAWNEGMA
ncbi:complement regulatory protein [Trypanosoma cruzi]|nr:complement regulatory protein [Trypanosoma cruzi]